MENKEGVKRRDGLGKMNYNPTLYDETLASRNTKVIVDAVKLYRQGILNRVKRNLKAGINVRSIKRYNVKIK